MSSQVSSDGWSISAEDFVFVGSQRVTGESGGVCVVGPQTCSQSKFLRDHRRQMSERAELKDKRRDEPEN